MLDLFTLPHFVFYLIAGSIGAFVISIGRFLFRSYVPHFPDMPLLLGRLIDWGKPDPEKTARILGSYLHLTLGALWGLLFGLLVQAQFFFVEFSIVSGILFSVLPWLFLMVVLLPLAGGGFFGLKFSRVQWLLALLLHGIAGAVMAALISLFIGKPF